MIRTFCALALFLCLAGAAAAAPVRPITPQSLSVCHRFDGVMQCRPVTDPHLNLNTPDTVMVLEVDLSAEAVRPDRPLMVEISGLNSSEVRWNGVVIGHNGRPAADVAHEIPGRLEASFTAPEGLARIGRNVITARVSSHHLWLPIYAPLHGFRVAFQTDRGTDHLRAYLPAFVVLSVLAAAGLYLGAAAVLDRRHRGAAWAAAIAGVAVLQLLTETLKAFVNYPYPFHQVRVVVIALLSVLTAVLIAAYGARRFAPAWRRTAPLAALAGGLLSLVVSPGFDDKAIHALQVGLLVLAIAAGRGLMQAEPPWRRTDAWAAMAFALVTGATTLMVGALFLDAAYYLCLAAGLVALVGSHLLEQVAALRLARRERLAETERAAALAASLERATPTAGRRIPIRDGARTHHVPADDILWLKGADDYCEVRLSEGRTLLSSLTLTALQAELPAQFVRIHRSWIVNALHVAAVAPRPGGGRMAVLDNGDQAPIGRTYGEAVRRWTTPTATQAAAEPRIAAN